MSQPYVYWRKPTGEPYKGNDDKHAPTAILERIGNLAITTPNSVGWPSGEFLQLDFIVDSSAVVIDPSGVELNGSDTSAIVSKALSSVIRRQGGGKAVKPREVLQESNKLAATFFSQPFADYILVSSLSVAQLPVNSVRIGECRITSLQSRGCKYPYPKAIAKGETEHLNIAKHLGSTRYHAVKVKTKGRTIHEAAEKAIDALNLLRGLWTLFGTYGTWMTRWSSTPKQVAIGAVHTGPIHTLHGQDGSLVDEVDRYDADYSGDQKLYDPKANWEKIEKSRLSAMRLLPRCPYRRDLEDLIRRYAVALDHTNYDVAFLQTWAILESITDTVGASYDETIRRATWIFCDRNVAKERLEHLRFLRNRYVHGAKSGDRRDQIVYSIKSLVEPHLLRLIWNDFKVKSLREYGEFLSLPNEPTVLREQAKRRTLALRMCEPKEKPAENDQGSAVTDTPPGGSPEKSSN